MPKATITAVVNQKGGTAKTTTSENLGFGLAREGKRVLLVDTDPQASLTIALGNPQPDNLEITLTDLMKKVINEEPIAPGEGILHHPEGVDLVPSSIELSGMEVSLVNTMNREKILRQYLDTVKNQYDFILIDCMPSLGMLTINALAAAENALIPVQAQYLSAKGLEQLLGTINKVRRQINPKLRIEGILLTIGSDLESLQAAVGGSIEVVYPFEDNVGLIMNEEGKIEGLPLNRALRDDRGELYDIIAGDFLVVGLTEDDFGSLSQEQMDKFEKLFHQPECFMKMGRSIMALPLPDDLVRDNREKPEQPMKDSMKRAADKDCR